MNRKTFFIVAIILVCVGMVTEVAIGALRSKTISNICINGDECTNTIKEYTPLEEPRDEDNSAGLMTEDVEPLSDPLVISTEEPQSEEFISPRNTIDHPYAKAGEDVETTEDMFITHNAFLAGNNVFLNHRKVDGIVFAAGNSVKSHGIQDYLVTAGNELSIDSNTEKDALIAGNVVNFSKNAQVRDAYIAASKVTLRGEITGSVSIAAGEVVIDGAIIRSDVNLAVGSVEFKGDNKIYGTLKYNDDATTTNMNKDVIAGIKTYETPKLNTEYSIPLYALQTVRTLCVTTVSVSLLALLLARVASKKYESVIKDNNGLKDLLIGLVSIIIIPSVVLILLFTSYLTTLGFLAAIIVAFGFLAGLAIAAVRFGKVVESLIGKKNSSNVYSVTLYGAAALAIVSVIPVVGATVVFFAVLAGFGFVARELLSAFKTKAKVTSK